jgi:uncharacterized phiE125 gp8 family phage protein
VRFLSLVTAPTVEPIDLTLAKLHLKQDVTDDDPLISDYITAARVTVEGTLRRSLITQTWDYLIDAFPWSSDPLELPRPPLQSVTSITYTDSAGNAAVWPASNYQVDIANEPARIAPVVGASWPSVNLRSLNGVVVRIVTGYGLAAAVPWNYRQAMLLLIGHWYENREPIMAQRGVTPVEIPFTIRALLGLTEAAGVS